MVRAKTLAPKQSRFGLAAFNLLALLCGFFILRLILFLHFKPETSTSGLELLKLFVIGLHLDLVVAFVLTLPLLLWLALIPNSAFGARWHRRLFRAAFLLFWALQIFLLCAEFFFFDEFKSRFNTVAVDYLFNPKEVFVNIWDSYPVAKVVLGCVGFAALVLLTWEKLFPQVWETPVSRRRRWLEFYAALGITLFLSLTINSNETRFSQERVLNEVANNGQRAFLNSALTRHLDFAGFYKTMSAAEAFGRTQRLLSDGKAQFVSPSDSLERSVAGNAARARLNVVIMLEESFGSEFWGCLGRSNSLTPEMDRLAASEGMLFTNLYASGNRTVRGFEGVLSSFPPLPGDSIVKRDQSQNVETIARILKRDGYQTVFLYGGRGLFDGMRSFALNNGYDRFIEQKDFPEARRSDYTKTIWGACDEIIFGRAIEEFRKLNDSGKQFLATILSVSNHKPYVYPRGRIPEDPDKPARMREKAVKYSDWCLGKFFTEARKETFWTNTIFVVVADHGARIYGSQSIPIHSYEIPMLILGPAVVKGPMSIPHLGCSLDVAPTVLGLLGRPYETLFFGRDLLNCPPSEGRVLLNHNRDIGLFRQDRLVVLGINKTVEYYHGNPKAEGLQRIPRPEPADLELEKDAMALYQMADELYTSRRYAVRETAPGKLNAAK